MAKTKRGPILTEYNMENKPMDRRCGKHPGPGQLVKGVDVSNSSVPAGICGCGCGQPTETWKHTERSRGRIAGEPKRFLHGHNGRKPGHDYSPVPPCPECNGPVSRKSTSGKCRRCQMRAIGKLRTYDQAPCGLCGAPVPVAHRIYCSWPCYKLGRIMPSGEGHHWWKDGDLSIAGLYIRAKKYVGTGPCEICGNPNSDMHHKDRDITNNTPGNIRFLCRSHHSRLHIHEDGPPNKRGQNAQRTS